MQRKASKGHLRVASDPNFHPSCRSDPTSKISWIVDATRTSQVESILWWEEADVELEGSRCWVEMVVVRLVVTEDCI